jgi:hypothetical protein
MAITTHIFLCCDGWIFLSYNNRLCIVKENSIKYLFKLLEYNDNDSLLQVFTDPDFVLIMFMLSLFLVKFEIVFKSMEVFLLFLYYCLATWYLGVIKERRSRTSLINFSSPYLSVCFKPRIDINHLPFLHYKEFEIFQQIGLCCHGLLCCRPFTSLHFCYLIVSYTNNQNLKFLFGRWNSES